MSLPVSCAIYLSVVFSMWSFWMSDLHHPWLALTFLLGALFFLIVGCCIPPTRVDVDEISSGTECAASNGPDTKNKLTTREN